MLLPATAQAQWQRIDPAELPPPYATRSTSNASRVVAPPAGALPQVPAGFTASLWASGLSTPRVIRRAPNGDIFLAESGGGKVLVFPARDGAPAAPPPDTFAADLTLPFGIAFWPPADPRFVYVAETGRVLRYPYRAGDRRARGPAETVLSRLPEGGHWTRDLAVAADGSRLFVAIGSETNVAQHMGPAPRGGLAAWETARGIGAAWGDEAGRAAVLQFAPDGGGFRPFATGLRNCSGLAVQPGTGAVWCVTNERDGLGDDLPPDYATSLRERGFYGWPWFYIGAHPDPRLAGRRPELAERTLVPDVLLPAHGAPLGIAFYDGTSGPAAFPPEFRGDAFVALHGSWNRSHPSGYKVIRLQFRDGRATGAFQDFVTGFTTAAGRVWARPAGVAVARDGALLVSEDANGTLWRIAPKLAE
ncbi:Sorbosone dehydrogenase family protein [Rhodovastum atsumiense]|uniref:PQQ-dependent sugar dehydrogenase n=1 Tax=Rhodovastum atsumiense TaxID=504468 RepID=UPI00139F2B68|nr:PQQ-dependent sugar dehydrogenase [Rhodovastum atsumiense]CAH2600136.1 Sorbosone dehydrogenase family protein [Rhodovastum atsumiense]